MATSSFDRSFVVSEKKAIAQLRSDLRKKHTVKVSRRDSLSDKSKGIDLLKQYHSD